MSADVVLAYALEQAAAGRQAVWVLPAEPGPWSGTDTGWWSAAHIALLPPGVSLLAALTGGPEVTVTLFADVTALASGLDELLLRADPATAQPNATRVAREATLATNTLAAPVSGTDLPEFARLRAQWRTRHQIAQAVAGSDEYGRRDHYRLRHPWPAGMCAQGGRHRLITDATDADIADPDVVTHGGKKHADVGVFLEVFPRNPDTYLRAEAADYATAEDTLWARWSTITGCPAPSGAHEYETRGYRNGCGFCRHCGLFSSGVFDLAALGSVCVVCGIGTYWSVDDDGSLYCPAHAPTYPCAQGHQHESRWDVEDCDDEHTRVMATAECALDPVEVPVAVEPADRYRVVTWQRLAPRADDVDPGTATVSEHDDLVSAERRGMRAACGSVTRVVWVFDPAGTLQATWRQVHPDSGARDNRWRPVGAESIAHHEQSAAEVQQELREGHDRGR